MSMWHFMAAMEGFGRANGWKMDEPVKAMSVERMKELGVWEDSDG